LAEKQLAPEGVFFACVNTQGVMTVQPMEGGCFSLQAIAPDEVMW